MTDAPPPAQPPVAAAAVPAGPVCIDCGNGLSPGTRSCQWCGQVQSLAPGTHLSSVAKRFGEYCLELLLIVVTLFIGWAIWSAVIYGRGQTPAKQLLKMRIVKLDTGRASSWGTTWIREWPGKFLIGIFSAALFYVPYFWLVWDKDNQELWDKMVDTVVVDDPDGRLAP